MKDVSIKLLAGLLIGASTVAAGAAVAKIVDEHDQSAILPDGSGTSTILAVNVSGSATRTVSVAETSLANNAPLSSKSETTTSPNTSVIGQTPSPQTQKSSSINVRHHDDEGYEWWGDN